MLDTEVYLCVFCKLSITFVYFYQNLSMLTNFSEVPLYRV